MRKNVSTNAFLSQYVYEMESWERLLSYQKEELVSYKNRLAEVVNSSADEAIVLAAEDLQEAFLTQERIVQFLADELKRQNHILEQEAGPPGDIQPETLKRQKKLRQEIKKGEEAFALVKEKFEAFLLNRFGLVF